MFKGFEEFSIFWLLISSIIGGIIGASIKFLFDKIITSRYNKNYIANEALKHYSFPLFQSATSLHKRLDFLVKNERDRDLYNESQDGYSIYKLSTLYTFCHFLGSGNIIQEEALRKFHSVSKKARKFYITFFNVYKGFSSMYYFDEIEDLHGTYEESTIPHFALSAIGEQMVEKSDSENSFKIIGFNNFVGLIKTDPDFNYWVKYIDNFLKNIVSETKNKDWNRILLVAIHVRILESYLDKKRDFTFDKKFHEYNDLLHESVQKKLLVDLKTLKELKIIKTMPNKVQG